MNKYNKFNDIIAESTLLSFSDFSYENKVSSFNVTIGESYSVKAKKDRQNGKFEFEMTDKFGNVKTYSEKKFISMFPEAYVKFKGELHDNLAKDDPELKDLDKMDKKIIKEDAVDEIIAPAEPVNDNIDFLFKAANPIDTDINSLAIVDFVISNALNADFDTNKLFHVLVSMPSYMNKTQQPLVIKAYRYPVENDFVLGKGFKNSEADSEIQPDQIMTGSDFAKEYGNLNDMFNAAILAYSSYVNKYKDEANDMFKTTVPYKKIDNVKNVDPAEIDDKITKPSVVTDVDESDIA